MSLIWPLAAHQFYRRHSSRESRLRFWGGSDSISPRINAMSSCVICRPCTVVVSSIIRYYHKNELELAAYYKSTDFFTNADGIFGKNRKSA